MLQLNRDFRKSQLQEIAAQQDLQCACLALMASRLQAHEWRDMMHTAEHRATALQQLVRKKEETIQELQNTAVNQASFGMVPELCIC